MHRATDASAAINQFVIKKRAEVSVEAQVSYGAFMIWPIVTATDNGRYTAAAILTEPAQREEHTVGADIDFGRREEAIDRAIEMAIAEIERRRVGAPADR
jgi:hypothetical protein